MNLAYTCIPRLGRSQIRCCRPTFDTSLANFAPRSVRAMAEFAEHFTRFEWIYLGSYPWFIAALQSAVNRGGFGSLLLRAEQQLINEGLRRRPSTPNTDVNESNRWLD